LLLPAARRLEPFDLELARRAYLTAWGAAVAAGPLTGAGIFLLTTDGRAAATPILQRAAKAVAEMPVEDVLRWGVLAPTASTAIRDSDGASAILERQA
jgi:hypothetical protein